MMVAHLSGEKRKGRYSIIHLAGLGNLRYTQAVQKLRKGRASVSNTNTQGGSHVQCTESGKHGLAVCQ
jgi:hypothetical protein